MLNLVARKSSSEGTFLTKRLIATIVACGVLKVKLRHIPPNTTLSPENCLSFTPLLCSNMYMQQSCTHELILIQLNAP